MKKRKWYTKFLAVFLVAITVIGILPMQTFATEYQNYKTLTTVDSDDDSELIIKEEIVEERTSNSKTYLLEDGTYCDLTTSAPIHTYIDGEWEDIDANSEIPDTIETAMSQLSIVQNDSMDTSVDDGLVMPSPEQPVSLWGINESGTITPGTVSFNGDDYNLGIVKFDLGNKAVYNKSEVTIKAELRLSCDNHIEIPDVRKSIRIYPIYSDWDWSNFSFENIESNLDNPMIDYNYIDNAGRYVWDITSEYIKLEFGEKQNNGFLLESNNYISTLHNGILRRHYRVIDDNDLGFTYHDVDMGRAGTFYINDYTNVPYLVRDELALSGNILPVSITRFINTGVENNSFGAGGRWNYESKLSKNADSYIWDMFNGSSTRFQRSIPIETDSDGREKWVEYQYNAQGYTLWIDTTKSREYDFSNNRIVDESGNIYTFTYYGFVNSVISGANENDVLTITYSGETISSITDGVGRKYSFTYGSINNRSVVTKISAYTNSETTETPVEIIFDNEIINSKERLTKATYPDGKSVEYTYDNIGRLTGIKNIDGSLLELNYAISASEIGQNISPVFAHRLSGYTKKCLNKSGEYVTEYAVNINAENSYHRIFEQKNNQDTVVFLETLQFNRNLDLLYLTNSFGDSFYADYDNNHNLTSLVIPEFQDTNVIENSKLNRKNSRSKIPDKWHADTDGNTIYEMESKIDPDGVKNDYAKINNVGAGLISLFQTKSEFQGHKGDKYVVSCWGLGKATIPKEDHFWGIRILAKNSEGKLVPIHQMHLDTSLWGVEQTRFTAFSLPFDTTYIKIQLVSDRQLNSVYFDDVYLYKTESAYVAAVDDVKEKVCKCEGCEYPFCTCKCASKDECNCASCNIKTSYTNDSHRNPLETKTTNGLTELVTKNEYTSNGNYLSKYVDENKVSTSYEYSLTNGLLLSKTLANGSKISYNYDAIGLLTSVSQNVTNVLTGDVVSMNTSYSYENDKIKSITHNGFSYTYDYDIYGNVKSINVWDTKLVSYEYNDDYYNNINKITYANGEEIIYSYDNKDNVIGIKFKGDSEWRYTYTYDEYNQLKSFTDNISNRITTYNKTIDGIKYEEVVETIGENSRIIYGITENNNGEYTQSVFGKDYSIKTETQYDSSTGNTLSKKTAGTVIFGEDGNIENVCTKDAFERITSDYMTMYTNSGNINERTNTSLSLNNEYTYKNASDTQTTRLIETVTSTVYFESESSKEILRRVSLKYDYDDAGRITMISALETNNGVTNYYPVNMYEYDEAGQLVVEANMNLGTVCSYTYDAGGNLTSKNYHDNAEFNETTCKIVLGEPTQTITYAYDSVWKDKLVSYNGTQINYDALGNPLNYTANVFNSSEVNMNLEWDGGLLTAATAVDGSNRYEYKYDANGLRTEKTLFESVSISEEQSDGSIKTTDVFVPKMKFEYIWSNETLSGYRITSYDIVTDDNGNNVLDDEGNIVIEVNNDNTFIVNMLYNEDGEALGVNCHSELEGVNKSLTFLFVKDAQGNVVSISALEGGYFFNLSYDSFGNPSLEVTGSEVDKIQQSIADAKTQLEKILLQISGALGIALVTGITFMCVPTTYRGYMYDMETGLYYCQSRYYSPEWGRFINADDTSLLELTTGNIHGANLFAYCGNDPINDIDPNGYLSVKAAGYIIDGVLLAINIASSALALKASIKAIRIISKEFVRLTKKKIVNMLRPLLGTISKAVIGFAVPALQSVAAYAVDLFFDMSFGYAIALAIYKYVPASRRVLTR